MRLVVNGTLRLDGTRVNDAGLVTLPPLTELYSLDLSRTQVTDAGLEHLKGFTELRYLRLTGTTVTDAGLESLQQALPDCQITR